MTKTYFETDLADSAWRWDFIDFWAQPLSQRGMKLERKKTTRRHPRKRISDLFFPEE